MRILLTGGRGMVGRNLLAHPLFSEREVLNPDRATLDLCDAPSVRKYLEVHKPDLIIHAAAKVGGIEANRRANANFMIQNTQLALGVIQSAKEVGIPNVINLASSCMYPKDRSELLKIEDILTGPLEPTNEGYALAKILAMKLCQFISTENVGYKYITVVPCNLYGPWDKFDPINGHLIPSIIRKVHEASISRVRTIDIWGDGSARREFMYVDDLVKFVNICVDNMVSMPMIVNVGQGIDYSVLDYYKKVCAVIDFQAEFTFDLSKPTGMANKLMDSSVANNLGWKAELSHEEGILRTYKYFQENLS